MSNLQKVPTTNGRSVMRVRFFVNIDECKNDYRTLIWPIPHPYWCSGETDNEFVLVAYVESEGQLYSQWPEAKKVEVLEEDLLEYSFSDRFSKPDWIEVGG